MLLPHFPHCLASLPRYATSSPHPTTSSSHLATSSPYCASRCLVALSCRIASLPCCVALLHCLVDTEVNESNFNNKIFKFQVIWNMTRNSMSQVMVKTSHFRILNSYYITSLTPILLVHRQVEYKNSLLSWQLVSWHNVEDWLHIQHNHIKWKNLKNLWSSLMK